jgi:Tim10/DDP family zinc finger
MDSVSSHDAHQFLATTKYLYDTNQLCFSKCVVDFQTKDISAMEKECALACLRKHMAIYKDLTRANQ